MAETIATTAERDAVFANLQRDPSNKICFDCEAKNATWTSIPFGVLLCLECSATHRNMGVHITFVKSSKLDKWTQKQLRRFKLGGNQKAKEYFLKNGGSRYLTKQGDAKLKYTSKVAANYKTHLDHKVAKDEVLFPNSVTLEHIDDSSSSSIAENNDSNDDFFANWEKKSTPSPITSRPLTPSNSGNNTVNNNTAQAKKPSTILRKSTASSKKTNILSGPRKAKITAKKVNTVEIDFDEVEKLAKKEAEEIAKLGYNPNEVNNDEAISKTTIKPKTISTQPSYTEDTSFNKSKPSDPSYKRSGSVENITPAFAKLGFGMTANDAVEQEKKQKAAALPKYTGDVESKYGGQKSISSDQYFGRNTWDETAQNEARSKLQAFSGSNAISSSSYFGEDEAAQGPNGSRRNTDFADFSTTAGDDLSVLKDALEEGANKLSGYLRDYLRN